jgi:hypothetical protein
MGSLEAKAAQLAKVALAEAAAKVNGNKNRDIMFVRSDAKGEIQPAEGAAKNPDEINIDEDEDVSESEESANESEEAVPEKKQQEA